MSQNATCCTEIKSRRISGPKQSPRMLHLVTNTIYFCYQCSSSCCLVLKTWGNSMDDDICSLSHRVMEFGQNLNVYIGIVVADGGKRLMYNRILF